MRVTTDNLKDRIARAKRGIKAQKEREALIKLLKNINEKDGKLDFSISGFTSCTFLINESQYWGDGYKAYSLAKELRLNVVDKPPIKIRRPTLFSS